MSAILNLPFCVYFFKKQTSPALTEIATLLLVLCAIGQGCTDWWLMVAVGCAILRRQRQNPLPGLVSRQHHSAQHAPACFFVRPSSTRNLSYDGLGRSSFGGAGSL